MNTGDYGGVPTPPRFDFFVSYTEADFTWAEWIAGTLHSAGYSVLFQPWNMVPGSNWPVMMDRAVTADMGRTIAVVSRAYLESPYSGLEWRAAMQADPDGTFRRLVPVRIENCERLGLLGQYVSTDLFGLTEEEARGRLLGAAASATAGRAKPAGRLVFPGLPTALAEPDRPRPSNPPAFPGHADPGGVRPPPAEEDFSALLIGVSAYDDPLIPELPGLAAGLADLGTALEEVGYHVDVHDMTRTGASALKAAIHSFLRRGAAGETQLLYLAGHVVHADGRDFLVPSDAASGYEPFWDLCVPLDWNTALERSSSAATVILVDACHDPETLALKPALTESRPRGRLTVEPRPGTAYLFACTPAGASPIAGSLTSILRTERPQATLAGLETALRDRLTAASPANEAALHTVQTGGPDVMRLLPRRRDDTPAAPEDPWIALATNHQAWTMASGPGLDAARAGAVAQVRALIELRSAASDRIDPWDDRRLAIRFTARLEFLLHRLAAADVTLAPGEAAFLVTMPFLHETFWFRHLAAAATVEPYNLDFGQVTGKLADFAQFVSSYPRLARRARRAREGGDQPTINAVGWWLLWRWLAQRPDTYSPEVVGSLIRPSVWSPPHHEVFAPAVAAETLRALRADPPFLSRTDRRGALVNLTAIGSATASEEPFRGLLAGYLLMVAHRMTIEITMLPDVIVEHLGVSYPVELPDLFQTVEQAVWKQYTRTTRVLSASCAHPAVEVALTEHTAALAALLAVTHRVAAERPAATPLAELPTHAIAEDVKAAVVSGEPAYSSAGTRFRMAEDKVQEVLMGEQLYSNRALAIRELYQNALDACRYRKAREEYLSRAEGVSSAWSGRIDFQQGLDAEGRPYLDCRDNGIGMGLHELANVFAEAGTRSVDLPEVVDERAIWATLDPPINFYPNSRFGVGVLSYFMLADEITVQTCRLDRDGRPGDRFEVTIAGPGNLFQIKNLGPGRDAGTTVRLHLTDRPDADSVSCVGILTTLLWVAEYPTTAVDGAFEQRWEPGRLSEFAPVGSFYSTDLNVRRGNPRILTSNVQGVWWCNGEGALLADGLWAEWRIFGAVINLTGPIRPKLSVDRNKILEYPTAEVDEHLIRAVPSLVESSIFPITPEWLYELTRYLPLVGDAIFSALAGKGIKWLDSSGSPEPVSQAGYFQYDQLILYRSDNFQNVHIQAHWIPDYVTAWRLRALRNARGVTLDLTPSTLDGAAPARPTDLALTGLSVPFQYDSNMAIRPWSRIGLGHILQVAAYLHRNPRDVANRYRDLGLAIVNTRLIEAERVPEHVPELIAEHFDAPNDREITIPVGLLLAFARRAGHSVAASADILAGLGYILPHIDLENPDTVDLLITSEDFDGRSPRIADRRITALQVATAALQTGSDPARIRIRYERLGLFAARPTAGSGTAVRTEDTNLFRRERTIIADEAPLGLAYVLMVAALNERGPGAVASRFREIGLPVVGVTLPSADTVSRQMDLLSVDWDGRVPWRDARPVYHHDIVVGAARTSRRPDDIVRCLGALGFTVPRTAARGSQSADNQLATDGQRISRLPARTILGSTTDIADLAFDTARDPESTRGYVRNLGRAAPDLSGLAFTPDDRVILDGNLRGSSPLYSVGSATSAAHVLVAAARLRRSPTEISARLRELGVAVADPDGVDLTAVTNTDLRLLSRDVDVNVNVNVYNGEIDGDGPWIADGVIPLAHLLAVAVATGQDLAEIRADATRLGLAAAPSPPVSLGPDDYRLLYTVLDGITPDDDGDLPVGPAAILATAFRANRDPAAIRDRLAEIGLSVPDRVTRPAGTPLGPADLVLLSRDLDGFADWIDDTTAPEHVLVASARTGWSVAEVEARLAELGFGGQRSPMEGCPDHVDATDAILLSRTLDGQAPWVDRTELHPGHALLAAAVMNLPLDDVRARFARLGGHFTASLVPTNGADDRDMLRVIFDGGYRERATPWTDASLQISAGQIRAAGSYLERPPSEIAARLVDLGLLRAVPDGLADLDIGPTDLLLLSQRLNGEGPWLPIRPVPLAHVLTAAGLLRWTPRRVAERLTELGHPAPVLSASAARAQIDGVDLALCGEKLTSKSRRLADKPVPRAHLLAASHRFWRPASQIAERMAELGFDVRHVDRLREWDRAGGRLPRDDRR